MTTTINASTSSGLVVTTDNSGAINIQANGTTVLSITSGGFALTPNNPRVCVSGTQGTYAGGGGSSSVLPANYIVPGQSNAAGTAAYNYSTYRFVCPVAGMYRISIFDIIQTAGSGAVFFRKNGTVFANSYSQQERMKAGSVIISCVANDYLDITSDSALYLNYADPYAQIYYELIG